VFLGVVTKLKRLFLTAQTGLFLLQPRLKHAFFTLHLVNDTRVLADTGNTETVKTRKCQNSDSVVLHKDWIVFFVKSLFSLISVFSGKYRKPLHKRDLEK